MAKDDQEDEFRMLTTVNLREERCERERETGESIIKKSKNCLHDVNSTR